MADETETLDFAVTFNKRDVDLRYKGSGTFESTIEFIEVNWYERIYPGVDVGLHVGKTFFSQSRRATTAGIEPNGFYGGIGIRAVFAEASLIRPFVHAVYLYRHVNHEENDSSITLNWHEPHVRFGASSAPWGPARIYGGVEWSAMDGRERVESPAVSSTTDFEQVGGTTGFLGIDLTVEPNGYIGVEGHGGDNNSGFQIYFKKHY
jgi:hypothetical protein